jgi:hypothetical protein
MGFRPKRTYDFATSDVEKIILWFTFLSQDKEPFDEEQ